MPGDSGSDLTDAPPSPRRPRADQVYRALFSISLLVVILAIIVLVFRIVMTDTSPGIVAVGTNTVEGAALIRANERIVQLVQWTISTVLIVAGGLLGLNWYLNQKRYEDDKKDLADFQQRIERRAKRDRATLRAFHSEIETRVRKTEQAQEQLAEQHRSHLLVQAVDELGRTNTVQDALATIVSWYGQIREADNERQERALSLLWQGFEYVEELIGERGADPVFYEDDPEAEARFFGFLDNVSETYPEVEEYVEFFRDIVAESVD